jgi:hypothetical protein
MTRNWVKAPKGKKYITLLVSSTLFPAATLNPNISLTIMFSSETGQDGAIDG